MERITSILFAYDPILNRLKPFTKTIEGEILDELSFRCFHVKPYFTVVKKYVNLDTDHTVMSQIYFPKRFSECIELKIDGVSLYRK